MLSSERSFLVSRDLVLNTSQFRRLLTAFLPDLCKRVAAQWHSVWIYPSLTEKKAICHENSKFHDSHITYLYCVGQTPGYVQNIRCLQLWLDCVAVYGPMRGLEALTQYCFLAVRYWPDSSHVFWNLLVYAWIFRNSKAFFDYCQKDQNLDLLLNFKPKGEPFPQLLWTPLESCRSRWQNKRAENECYTRWLVEYPATMDSEDIFNRFVEIYPFKFLDWQDSYPYSVHLSGLRICMKKMQSLLFLQV